MKPPAPYYAPTWMVTAIPRSGQRIGVNDLTESLTLLDLAERAGGRKLPARDKAHLTTMLVKVGSERLQLFTSLQMLAGMISLPPGQVEPR